MRFTPKTQQQIDEENLCAPGTHPFTVNKAEEAVDKNGDGFFKVKLFVHAPDGRDWHVYDNLSPVWMAHKLLHFCEGTGLGAKYISGSLTVDDLIDAQGHCEVEQEEASGKYAAKNIVKDYIVREKNGLPAGPVPPNDPRLNPAAKPKLEPAATGQRPEDSEVPF